MAYRKLLVVSLATFWQQKQLSNCIHSIAGDGLRLAARGNNDLAARLLCQRDGISRVCCVVRLGNTTQERIEEEKVFCEREIAALPPLSNWRSPLMGDSVSSVD